MISPNRVFLMVKDGAPRVVLRAMTLRIAAGEDEEYVSVDYEKCIGCGVCVSTCKPHFVSLMRRETV